MQNSHEMLLLDMTSVEAVLGEHLPSENERIELATGDTGLLEQLWVLNDASEIFFSEATNLKFHDEGLAGRVRVRYDADSLTQLTEYLKDSKTLGLPIIRNKEHQICVNNEPRDLTFLAATEIGTDGATHGDMSSMIYLRDQIQTATALMEISMRDPESQTNSAEDGRDLLVSALHLMSTDTQLQRLENVIRIGREAGQADWPNISIHFNDLEGKEPNGWRNKQDSFQMLAYLTLDALDRGFIAANDLAPAHRRFLGAIVPLLAAVGFPKYESSGSWEELEATRTSVMAVETALLAKIQKLPRNSEVFRFLEEGYGQYAGQTEGGESDFERQVNGMVQAGLTQLGQRIPYESPDKEYVSIELKLRDADAALMYVLRYGIPQLLAENHIPMAVNRGDPMPGEAIEDLIIMKIVDLIDKDTNGVFRYLEDSYQRTNFHTNSAQMVVKAIKGMVKRDAAENKTEADLDKKQQLRNRLMPEGTPAAWAHPLGQMASWSGGRSREMRLIGDISRADYLEQISTVFLNAMLTTVTGDKQWNAAIGADGRYMLKQVPARKVPECIIRYETAEGKTFTVPSPHTPLNWGTAMLLEALGKLKSCMAQPREIPVSEESLAESEVA